MTEISEGGGQTAEGVAERSCEEVKSYRSAILYGNIVNINPWGKGHSVKVFGYALGVARSRQTTEFLAILSWVADVIVSVVGGR